MVPASLNAEQKELLRKFGQSLGEPAAAAGESKSFFDKHKKKK
jgi:hypothetical protein